MLKDGPLSVLEIVSQELDHGWMSTMRVQGQVSHLIGSMVPGANTQAVKGGVKLTSSVIGNIVGNERQNGEFLIIFLRKEEEKC